MADTPRTHSDDDLQPTGPNSLPHKLGEGGTGEVRLAIYGLALAALLRGGYQIALTRDPTYGVPHGNAAGFVRVAREILGGDLLGGDGVFFYGPLYPYFLALCFWLGGGESLLVPRIVQAMLGLGLALLVYRITRASIGDARAAIWAAGLMAFYGPAFFFEGLLVATTLSTFLLMLGLMLVLEARPDAWGKLAGAGVVVGLACWGRTNALLLLPLLAGWILFASRARGNRRALLAAGFFVLGVCLAILPVTLRNRAVGGDWVLLVGQGGINLFVGNHPSASGCFEIPLASGIHTDADGEYYRNTRQVAEADLGRSLRPSEVSRYWTGRALAWIRDEPAAAAALSWRKLRLFVDPFELPIHRNAQLYLDSFWPVRFLPRWGAVLALALAGMLLAPPGLDRRGLLAALAVVYAGTVILFFVSDRYRFPVVPLLMPFAGLAASRFTDAARGRATDRRTLAAAGSFLAALVVLHGLAVTGPERRAGYLAMEYQRHGAAWERLDRPDRALEAYERAVAAAPGHVPSRLAQARLLLDAGEVERAVSILETLSSLRPDLAEAQELLRRARDAMLTKDRRSD